MGFFKKLFGKKTDDFYAPMAGKAVPITEVPDPTFSEGMLGNGIAIEPAEGKVYAPCDATVDMMFTTGHAVSLVADCGAEILIHVGLETVGLEGKPFTIHVANGDKVKKGQLLLEADLEAIKAAGLPIIGIHELKEKAERITGKPKALPKGDRVVAEVIYRDGKVQDYIYNVPEAL